MKVWRTGQCIRKRAVCSVSSARSRYAPIRVPYLMDRLFEAAPGARQPGSRNVGSSVMGFRTKVFFLGWFACGTAFVLGRFIPHRLFGTSWEGGRVELIKSFVAALLLVAALSMLDWWKSRISARDRK